METKEFFGPTPPPVAPGDAAEPALETLVRAAERYATKARADGTLERYRGTGRRSSAWCELQGAGVLPTKPQAVAMYLAVCADAGIRPTTLGAITDARPARSRARWGRPQG